MSAESKTRRTRYLLMELHWWVAVVLQILIVPILACSILSVILYGELNSASYIPLIFAIPGAILISAIHSKLLDAGVSTLQRYAVLLLAGFTIGGLMLSLSYSLEVSLLGALYGAVTTLLWIVANHLLRRLFLK